ncbi:hypothetical protein [Luteimonas panaciterrae]|uniref:hypothetical protein n=1 Tax=Luteimonas panaciterrae TaxID=363885 RepID=UPI001CF99A87|nr:hypothetical protein [Luteimonas panaciterrae]
MNGETRLAKFADALTKKGAKPSSGQDVKSTTDHALINGHANDMVYKLLPRKDRRVHGVFFSGSTWARALVEQLNIEQWSRFLDPSAGTGDLLLEICKGLPLEETSTLTIKAWEKRLGAIDLRESFLRIAWARIQALAMTRHRETIDTSHFRPLPRSFRAGNLFTTPLTLHSGDCLVMNPPYQRMLAGRDSYVGAGKRSAAALHVEYVLRSAPENVGLIALVPDVLRSGSSYKGFREALRNRMEITSFNGHGSFGGDADIDVAILRAVTKSLAVKVSAVELLTPSQKSTGTLEKVADLCSVGVGPVVPHRTEETGRPHGYLTARNSPIWGAVETPTEKARFEARLQNGPFVVVRRTSSPKDKQRARATLVRGKGPWLVENHLLVISPRSGTIKDCQKIIKNFKDFRTDEWLNHHIRCRHLTVEAIASVPIWDGEQA